MSCVITLANPVPSLYNFVLYGCTSIAIITIVIGLYLVIEN